MPSTRRQLETGVPGFDTLLGGGLPEGQSLMITGEPGTGKTVLASQVAFAHAARGVPVVIATVTSEPHDKLLADLAGFDFFSKERLGEELFFLSVYSTLKKGPAEARDLLVSTVRERKARLLVIDGLRAVRDLWGEEAKVREFFYELGVGLSAAGCTVIFTTEYPLSRLLEYPEATTVDALVALSWRNRGVTSFRGAEVVKVRGQPHLLGCHSMRIDHGGVVMVPRMESSPLRDRDYQPSRERAGFNLPALDALMEGGLPVQTSTLIAGGAGIGKTLLGLYFAAAGARKGEGALVYSFREPPRSLICRAQRLGLELEPLIGNGSFRIEYPPPTEADADELASDILEKVARAGCGRVVVDGLVELEQALPTPERARPYFAAFVSRLRAAGATAIFTKQISKIVGPELDFSDTPVAAIAENLLLLRHVELRGQLKRVLSILNLRDSGFDGGLREFTISEAGFRVLDPVQSAEGVLTGLARFAAPEGPKGEG